MFCLVHVQNELLTCRNNFFPMPYKQIKAECQQLCNLCLHNGGISSYNNLYVEI